MVYVNNVTFYVEKSNVSKEFMDQLMKALDSSYKVDNYCYEFKVTRPNNLSMDYKTAAKIEFDSNRTLEQHVKEIKMVVDNLHSYMDNIA